MNIEGEAREVLLRCVGGIEQGQRKACTGLIGDLVGGELNGLRGDGDGGVAEGDQVAAGEDPAAFRALEEFKGERFCTFCGEVVAELVIDGEATIGIERGGTLQRAALQIIWGE